MVALGGEIEIETSVAPDTTTVSVPVTPWYEAEIVADPAAAGT